MTRSLWNLSCVIIGNLLSNYLLSTKFVVTDEYRLATKRAEPPPVPHGLSSWIPDGAFRVLQGHSFSTPTFEASNPIAHTHFQTNTCSQQPHNQIHSSFSKMPPPEFLICAYTIPQVLLFENPPCASRA